MNERSNIEKKFLYPHDPRPIPIAIPQDYIGQQLNERSDIEKKFHAMKEDLITRLQNACAQRDEARGQVRP